MRRKMVSGIMLSLLGMLTLMFSIQPVLRAQKTSVVVGWAYPLTGPLAITAATHHLYYQMIVDDYNAKGGLNVPGYGMLPIEVIAEDDEFDPARSLTLIEKLITEDQVDLLFAPWGTAFNVAALPLYEQYHFPVVGLTVGSNQLSDLLSSGTYKYFFVTLAQPREDAEQLVELIQYINDEIASPDQTISRAGFAYRSDEHGIEHGEAMRDGLLAAGIEVPVWDSYDWMVPPADWTPQINKFRDADLDVVILSGYDEGANFVHQCITQDYNPKMLFIGPTMECPFLVYGPFGFTPGEMAGICYYNGWPATTYDTPELEAWVEHHIDYAGYQPFPASAVFYSGLECLFDAVEEHGLDRELIRDALANDTFDTLVGTFKFNAGLGPTVEGHGSLTQWQGGDMMDVVWPLDAATGEVIYPKYPWSWAAMPDLNRDGIINIVDISMAAVAFGSEPGHPRWNPTCDVNGDGTVNIVDIAAIAVEFGETV